jgi:hypothetical protein
VVAALFRDAGFFVTDLGGLKDGGKLQEIGGPLPSLNFDPNGLTGTPIMAAGQAAVQPQPCQAIGEKRMAATQRVSAPITPFASANITSSARVSSCSFCMM